jgi:hypothetical protein
MVQNYHLQKDQQKNKKVKNFFAFCFSFQSFKKFEMKKDHKNREKF